MHHIPSMRGTGCQVHIPYKQVIPLPSWVLHSSGKFYSLRKQEKKKAGIRQMAVTYQLKAHALKSDRLDS